MFLQLQDPPLLVPIHNRRKVEGATLERHVFISYISAGCSKVGENGDKFEGRKPTFQAAQFAWARGEEYATEPTQVVIISNYGGCKVDP